jgi:hypothetical protein
MRATLVDLPVATELDSGEVPLQRAGRRVGASMLVRALPLRLASRTYALQTVQNSKGESNMPPPPAQID